MTEAFLAPPLFFAPPDEGRALRTRAFQGIPSLAVTLAGRLWATWYAGPTPNEDQNNYAVLATSGDGGRSWTEPLVADPDGPGPVRAFDPELWMDPRGRLWFFWTQSIGHHGAVAGVWASVTETPERADARWSAPRRLADGVMMCKPLVLTTGEWALPVSTWRTTDNSARMLVSLNDGLNWTVRGACHVPPEARTYDEHMIVERTDGSLWMLVRTGYGIGESRSTDGGRTWPPLAPSALAHPSARFFIQRLQSGRLLLVKHGPLAERIGRSHLTAYLSADDGLSWTGGLLIDARKDISYPDGQQDAGGLIHIIYDRSRTGAREILLASFREEQVAAGVMGEGLAPRVVSAFAP